MLPSVRIKQGLDPNLIPDPKVRYFIYVCTFPQNNIVQNSLNFLLFLTVRNRDPTESDPESGGRGWGWPAGEVRLFNNAENKNRFTRETYK